MREKLPSHLLTLFKIDVFAFYCYFFFYSLRVLVLFFLAEEASGLEEGIL